MATTVNNNNIETLMGATLVWLGASNLQGEYLLESYTKATKGKAEVWLRDKASGYIITMDLSRRTLGDLQQTGEHRTDAGTTIRIKQDAERPLWISVNNGVAGDIFKEWGEAVSDLQRHVYNTLQGCCGCEIHRESATRYQAYFEDDDKWEVSEVVPFDPTKPDHREAKKEAMRKDWEERKRKEQEKQNSFAEGMRVKVPAASLERNRDKEAFVITRIRRKAAENGGNASLTVKSELTGMERDINGSDVSEILPALQAASEITDENEAARALAGKEARFVISDKDGRETLSHSFTFKDSFRNQANRIWIDVKEKGDVIGRWLMLKYDVIKVLANTGRVVVSHPDGERHCITLA